MTKTQKILDALAQRPMTAEELEATAEIDTRRLRDAIAAMRKSGYITSIPTTYSLTERGEVWQKRERKTPPEIIARKVQQRREKKLENISMIEQAKKQPNSVFQLGGR